MTVNRKMLYPDELRTGKGRFFKYPGVIHLTVQGSTRLVQ